MKNLAIVLLLLAFTSVVMAASSQTFSADTDETITPIFGGTEHTVEVVSVYPSGEASFYFNGDLKSKSEGEVFTIMETKVKVENVVHESQSNGQITFKTNPSEETSEYELEINLENKNSEKIDDAEVEVNDQVKETDENGKIIFELPEGKYEIDVEKSNYQTKSLDVELEDHRSITVSLDWESLQFEEGKEFSLENGEAKIIQGDEANSKIELSSVKDPDTAVFVVADGKVTKEEGSNIELLENKVHVQEVIKIGTTETPVGIVELEMQKTEEEYNLKIKAENPEGSRLENVDINLENGKQKETDSDGEVNFQLKEGIYSLEASKQGFQPEENNVIVNQDSETKITLSREEKPDIKVEELRTKEEFDDSNQKVPDTLVAEVRLEGEEELQAEFSVFTGEAIGEISDPERTIKRTLQKGSNEIEINDLEVDEGPVRIYADTEIDEKDENNNAAVYKIKEKQEEKIYAELSLHKGWNMISVPRKQIEEGEKLQGIYPKELKNSCNLETYQNQKLWQYSGSWKKPEAVAATQGVMVKAEKKCSLKIGNEFSGVEEAFPEGEEMAEGWNMISVPQPMTLNQVSGDCRYRDYQDKPVWHYSEDGWKTKTKTSQLDPNKGYYIKTSETCSLNFEKSNSEPPTPE